VAVAAVAAAVADASWLRFCFFLTWLVALFFVFVCVLTIRTGSLSGQAS
jgi:hypothetical protein